jgi:hypothetical protein
MLVFGLGTLPTPRTDTLSAIICRVRLRTDTRLNVANAAQAHPRFLDGFTNLHSTRHHAALRAAADLLH